MPILLHWGFSRHARGASRSGCHVHEGPSIPCRPAAAWDRIHVLGYYGRLTTAGGSPLLRVVRPRCLAGRPKRGSRWNELALVPKAPECPEGRIDVLGRVGGRHLDAQPCRAFRHHRKTESSDEDSELEQSF